MKLFSIDLMAGWQRRSAEQLAAMIGNAGKMQKAGLTDAFQSVSAYGADEVEKNLIFADLLKVYGLPSSRFMDDLQSALHSGDSRKIAVHAKIGAALLGWSELTLAALASVIEQLTIAPTAAEITTELGKIGFSWDSSAWVAVDIP